jgi:hypothetical protein
MDTSCVVATSRKAAKRGLSRTDARAHSEWRVVVAVVNVDVPVATPDEDHSVHGQDHDLPRMSRDYAEFFDLFALCGSMFP